MATRFPDNFDIVEDSEVTCLGNHDAPEAALQFLNHLFAERWYNNELPGKSPVVLKGHGKEYPVKITGEGKNRVATIVK